ncbi:MAG: DUF2207 domain-containing protein [Ancrocorticia sp.]|nr:DUF2207 domain-containing protein [Ancrocorticia sp.]MCI1896199.1 DUF2207 domain-containing protein [Ancrocorticia sp.]MCI1932905.1 DUF2207 domain-containing protein [Ancrocorticia sp.]MCI1963594.1 DUF2207 domain-containing protein [Ancrocorticia sp.]MCI2002655.1 DUF2207 domain-containing protein [Ancrocorticia sp.]
MQQLIGYFGVTNSEFWVGIAAICLAFFLLLIALRPEREYADLPRGVFPEPGSQHPTCQVHGGAPPVRSELPQMSVAEAALVYHTAEGRDLLTATILDLAQRGFLRLVEYRNVPTSERSVVVTFLRGPDESCSAEERELLELLAVPGAVESPLYAPERPFDVRRYRTTLESSGIPPLGMPTARVAGIRLSLAEDLADSTFHRIQVDRGWLRYGRQQLGTAGALEVIGGIVGAIVAGILTATGALRPFWIIVCVLVALLGLVTILGAAERTADGVVARDQVVGFREYIVTGSRDTGATPADFAHYAGWAVALDCVHEWAQSLERLSVGTHTDVESALHWANRTAEPFSQWHEVEDFVAFTWHRMSANPDADDTHARMPLTTPPTGW